MTAAINKPAVAAYRKACRPTGIGLSHYVLVVNAPVKKETETASGR